MYALMISVTLKICTRVVKRNDISGVLQLSMFLWFFFWLYLPDWKHDSHVLDNREELNIPESHRQHNTVKCANVIKFKYAYSLIFMTNWMKGIRYKIWERRTL